MRSACSVTAFLLLAPQLVAGLSNSSLDLSPNGKQLAVADADENVLVIADVAGRRVEHRVSLSGRPEGVTWCGDSGQVAVALYEADAIALIDAASGNVKQQLPVGDEPYGLVADPSGHRLWATLDFPGEVVEIDPATATVVRRLKVAPNLRGLALAADGRSLYATGFHTGTLFRIDLVSWRVAEQWDGQPNDNLCRAVALHPQKPKAYLSHLRSRTHVFNARGSIVPFLTVCSLEPQADPRRRSFALDTYNGVYVTANPWESAISPNGAKLYTIYAGTDDINASELLADGYREIARIAIGQVGRHPRAIRINGTGDTLFVYEAVEFAVSTYDAATLKRTGRISLGEAKRPASWRRGMELFNTAKPPMTSARWVSCSSCHPDGQSDGRVWENPEGLRRTPSLAGLAHTHPLHWSADRDEVQDFEFTIRGKLMNGRGLTKGSLPKPNGDGPVELQTELSGKSADLDALAEYTNSYGFTLSPFAAGRGQLTPSAERGRQLFYSSTTACATCHGGPYYTDSRREKPYLLHDVGTGDPNDKMGPKYDTPTLLGVYRNRSYLHHGKAATLDDVLTTCNSKDQHGKTSQMSAAERADLVEFLKSLPYEPPPVRTSNTVDGIRAKK